ncbi:stress response protein nst1-like [Hordeum vulgare subsp. vulgare]|uniref:stress response protein nst1-like n=1 Tax=Hordeum vulgare subsp. vulgare TaxID=112509 RepID=UPI001D1A4BE7|nr:stress response protein nst1-like [Hordeum vulgare subsp. vulgare]
MAASQPNKAKAEWGEEKDAASEEQRLMERAAKKLREEDAAEARKKKDEEHKARMDEQWQMELERRRYEARIKENDRKTLKKCKKEYEANFKKMMAEGAAKREWEHQRFTERVKEEASKMRKREEEEEEERKKKKGKGPCSTQ